MDDRTSMHRIIDAGLKEERSHSMVRALLPDRPDADGSDDPTTVANLSQLIQSIRSEQKAERESDDMPPSRRGHLAYVLAVAAMLGVGVGSFLFWTNRNDASVPAAVTAVRDDPRVRASRTAAPSPPPASAEVTAAPTAAATNATVQNPGAPPRSFVSPRRHTKEIARRAPPGSEATAEPAPPAVYPTARETVAPRASAASHTEVAEGEDFRRLKPQRDRKLDTEDPFQ
jgi:hypothetical protein